MPVYYPYPYSYVGHVAYNTTTGAWVQGGAVYGPYGGVAKGGTAYNPTTGAYGAAALSTVPTAAAGAFSYYNPSTGGYAHGSASWSNGSGSANASYYNPRTGVTGTTNQNANPYSRWGSSTLTGPNQTVNTKSGSNARGSAGGFQSSTGAQGAGYRGVNGNRGGAVKTQNGDVYAGHDGNAYQHTSDGWSKWNNGGWQPVNPPTTSTTRIRSPAPRQPKASVPPPPPPPLPRSRSAIRRRRASAREQSPAVHEVLGPRWTARHISNWSRIDKRVSRVRRVTQRFRRPVREVDGGGGGGGGGGGRFRR